MSDAEDEKKIIAVAVSDFDGKPELEIIRGFLHTPAKRRALGLGLPFIDPKEEAIQQVAWSQTAPPWRQACYGLNLEGICTNKTCKAFSNRIIHQWGKSKFNFFTEGYRVKCPICQQPVSATTCGFSGTEWKISGKKLGDPGQPPETFLGKWHVAKSDGYTTFDENLTTMATWFELVIELR